MKKTIQISEELFKRLQGIAVPLEDTSETLIERLLDHYDSFTNNQDTKEQFSHTLPEGYDNEKEGDIHLIRSSRQRGIKVQVGEDTIKAESVSDLYAKVLELLYNKGSIEKIRPHVPISTSRQRYLISIKPVHPNGNNFFVPVEYRGLFMEAHKDYRTGLKHLRKMLNYADIKLTVMDEKI
jgi:hypothetical protein